MPSLPYLSAYPEALLAQVRQLLAEDRVTAMLARRYPERHEVRTDKALFDYVNTLKQRHMRNAPPLARVAFDSKLQLVKQALGTHTAVSRVQGGRLQAPAEFLKMIVVHELAHLKEPQHDKAFYQLCCYMAPDYHQLEFDLRLYLTQRELAPAAPAEPS